MTPTTGFWLSPRIGASLVISPEWQQSNTRVRFADLALERSTLILSSSIWLLLSKGTMVSLKLFDFRLLLI